MLVCDKQSRETKHLGRWTDDSSSMQIKAREHLGLYQIVQSFTHNVKIINQHLNVAQLFCVMSILFNSCVSAESQIKH